MNQKPLHIFFQGISLVLNPFLIPTIGLFLVFYQIPGSEFYSTKVRNILLLIYFLSTCLLPVLFILFFVVNRGGSKNLDYHRDRIVPYLFTAISAFMGAQLIGKLPVPGIFRLFLLGISLLVVISLIISFRWKISGHLSAIGGLLGVLTAMNFRYGINSFWMIIAVTLAAGVLGSSRIYLGKHSPAQVYAGFFLGLASMFSVLFFI